VVYQLAQINIAKIRGVNIDDPVMQEFVDNLDRINNLAESSSGFIWRLKDESGNATDINPYDDSQIIVNISVWESVGALRQFTYQTVHADFVKRRKEWFQKYHKTYYALWWIEEGKFPNIEESTAKLDLLDAHGPSKDAFNFKQIFEHP